jgi:hypothetical protein
MASFDPTVTHNAALGGPDLRKHNSSEIRRGNPSPSGRLSAGRYRVRTGKPKRGTRRTPPSAPPRRRPYRKHRNGKSVIPADRLPQAPRWIASIIPDFILTTLEVLSLLTQGGRVPVSIAALAAARGRAPSTVRNHLRLLRMALIICVVEHPEEHNYNGPNSFIFLTLDPSKDTHIFQNCRGEQFVFKASSIYTLLSEKISIRGKEKAKVSPYQRKWEDDHKENHPKWFKNDWWQRKKERRKKNHQPEVRQKYKEQREEWRRRDQWREAHPHHHQERAARAARMAAAARIGTYDPDAWVAITEYEERRARMTPEQLDQEREQRAAELAEWSRLDLERTAAREARAADLAERQRQARLERERVPLCELCGDGGRVQRGRAFVDCPQCKTSQKQRE